MKHTIKTILILLLAFGIANIAMAADVTTIYIDGVGSTDNHYKTLREAIQAVHKLTNPTVNIILTVNTTESQSVTINKTEDITIVTNGERHSINFKNDISDFRCIGVNGKLTIGGTGFPIIRATEGKNSSNIQENNSKILIKVNTNAELNIKNAELAYGRNVIWIAEKGAVVNFNQGIIHSATEQNVNITHGTFNMKGGYICGHYQWKNGSPAISINPIMDYNSFDGKLKGDVPKNGEILDLIKACYGVTDIQTGSIYNVNTSGGVYLHDQDSRFNMEGGIISGIINPYRHDVIVEWDGSKLIYTGQKYGLTAVSAHQGIVNISGGKLYGNYAKYDGAALFLSYPNYTEVEGRYDLAVGNISGNALLAYNQSDANGGAVRVEKATTLNLTGGKIAYNIAGGGGGIRVVSSKLTMSGNAEICFNHSLTINDEKYNGGGIGAVYQASYGDTYTIVELKGGKIHHNLAEGNGGGVTVTDKGNEGEHSGIKATFEGVEIFSNTSNDSGGGVYIGGGASIVLDMNTKLHDNTAANDGGGFYLGAINGHTGSLTTKTCEIYKNKVTNGNGGGIFTEYSPVTVQDGTQIYSHSIDGAGAAVYLGTASSFTQTGGLIYDNHAKLSGGAVAILDGECNIFSGKVYNNTTDENGAGVYVHLDSKDKFVRITGAEFSENKAKYGGAFYIDGGSCIIKDGQILSNESTMKGGSIFLAGGNVTVEGGKVSGNISKSDGGAFYIDGGDMIMNNGELSGNISKSNGGGAYINGGIVTFSNGKLKKNEAINGGGIYLASNASMTFTDGLIAENKAKANSTAIETAYNANGTANGCGGGIYLQKGTSTQTSLVLNVQKSFGLYSNLADRAGDDIVAEGVNTSVTIPNVEMMDLKDFEGKSAKPNWYEDYVYPNADGDTMYKQYGILKLASGSGNRFRDMINTGLYSDHLIEFDESQKSFNQYVCLSLGYQAISIIISTEGLKGNESILYNLKHLVKKQGEEEYSVKETFPVLLSGDNAGSVISRTVKNVLPGEYLVEQAEEVEGQPWAWSYTFDSPATGEIQKYVKDEDGVNNLFPFKVKRVGSDENVEHDEAIVVNNLAEKE